MKVKLLLPPLVIVLCIALMVWFVYPVYTNGANGVKEQRQMLAAEKKKMSEAQEKSNNISRLAAQLESNKADQSTIIAFVPENLREEEIIDNLNFIASNEGLSVIKLSIKPKAAIPQVEMLDERGNVIPDTSGTKKSAVKTKDYVVEFSVVGNYEKIKNVFEKIYKLGRYNIVESLEIKKQETQSGSDKKSAPTDTLVANANLKFNMLSKAGQTIDINNPAFSKTSFNLETAQAIRSKKNVEILKMSIDQAGRSNPFLP